MGNGNGIVVHSQKADMGKPTASIAQCAHGVTETSLGSKWVV